ncbi:SRPBCC family protein [Olivibacter sp. XZL3]|uniref:SRPBCC family protein n=1 Tax=Olivibacter sp. XZL3 TaxID=1735116 RepID=UPI0010662FE9|nr:SRPBCC family protein [Olivibacter sp. XZL3]
MPLIELTTNMQAEIDICFDLSRSIDLHCISTAGTEEKAIGGVTCGLIGLGETVTWQATHFGIRQRLTSKITAYERPFHFRDEQVQGPFAYIRHDHFFKTVGNSTLVTDHFDYDVPYGIFGRSFDRLLLNNYLRRLLEERNRIVKDYAECGRFMELLGTG